MIRIKKKEHQACEIWHGRVQTALAERGKGDGKKAKKWRQGSRGQKKRGENKHVSKRRYELS